MMLRLWESEVLDAEKQMVLPQNGRHLSPITYRIHHVWHHEALGAFNSRNEALRYRLNTSKFPPHTLGKGGFMHLARAHATEWVIGIRLSVRRPHHT